MPHIEWNNNRAYKLVSIVSKIVKFKEFIIMVYEPYSQEIKRCYSYKLQIIPKISPIQYKNILI